MNGLDYIVLAVTIAVVMVIGWVSGKISNGRQGH